MGGNRFDEHLDEAASLATVALVARGTALRVDDAAFELCRSLKRSDCDDAVRAAANSTPRRDGGGGGELDLTSFHGEAPPALLAAVAARGLRLVASARLRFPTSDFEAAGTFPSTLNLANAGLRGYVAGLLARTPELSRLDLRRNRLEGPLSALPPRLIMLNLSSCGVAGAWPRDATLQVLESLEISRNAFRGRAPMGTWPRLRRYDISRNRFDAPRVSELFESLPPGLAELNASRNPFPAEPLVAPALLARLEILRLNGLGLAGGDVSFGPCAALRILELSNNALDRAPRDLGALKVLRLDFNRLAALPRDLEALAPRLEVLALHGNSITAPLGALTELADRSLGRGDESASEDDVGDLCY